MYMYVNLPSDNTYIEVLDSTRVHPETYEWARKMAVDALEYDEVLLYMYRVHIVHLTAIFYMMCIYVANPFINESHYLPHTSGVSLTTCVIVQCWLHRTCTYMYMCVCICVSVCVLVIRQGMRATPVQQWRTS